MFNSRDRIFVHRAAFTLAELLIVIAIIAVLAAILVPTISRARRGAQIIAMKQELQTIEGALENYHTDFRAYPIPGSSTTGFPGTDPALTPRTDASLAIALIGPGPASLLKSDGTTNGYTNNDTDGADGPGFKAAVAVYASTSLASAASAGATSITVSFTIPAPAAGFVAPPAFTIVSLGGPGSPDANIAVKGYSGTNIDLAVPLQANHALGETVGLLAPAGRTWGPYLPVDKIPIGYVYGALSSASANTAYPAYPPVKPNIPVLLDIWGGPIQYFPAYNSATNNVTLFSNPNPPTNVIVGPLLGSPGNKAVLPNNRVPLANFNGAATKSDPAGYAVFWDGTIDSPVPANISPGPYPQPQPAIGYWFTPGQRRAILFKLGDQLDYADFSTPGSNFAMAGMILGPPPATGPKPTTGTGIAIPQQQFMVNKPYFLMSAGPDGVFTDLYYNGVPNATPHAPTDWPKMMQQSDDVYSFDQ